MATRKKSWGERLAIAFIALILIGSSLLTYVALIMSNNKEKNDEQDRDESIAKIQEAMAPMQERAKELSDQYFEKFNNTRSEIKSFNAESANSEGVNKRDIIVGSGDELAAGDFNYYAYYVGYCPDESVFDSSFNNIDDPSELKEPINASMGLIEGWNQGVEGMKLNGIREITIPGELAYGEAREMCGMKNAPLRFIVMPIRDEELSKLEEKLIELQTELQAEQMY